MNPNNIKMFGSMLIHKRGIPQALFVDITNSCNLRETCGRNNCSYYAEGSQDYCAVKLTDIQWLQRIKQLKEQYPLIHCIYLGGEPMLRFQLIQELSRLFYHNIVITNGTFSMPKIKNLGYWISMDGLPKRHEAMRGNIWLVMQNKLLLSNACKLFNFTVTEENIEEIELFLDMAYDYVSGVRFAFLRPVNGNAEKMQLKNPSAIANRLIELKKLYGSFIFNSYRELNIMGSQDFMDKNCMICSGDAMLLKSDGTIKPCVHSQHYDKSITPSLYPIMAEKNIEAMWQAMRAVS